MPATGEQETVAEVVARTRRDQGLPPKIPASSLRALAEHIKAGRDAQGRKQERVAS
jgi:hypothetical protein